VSRWGLCALLFLATTLNYLDRQTLGILAPLLQGELGLDNRDLGNLFSAFYYTYTFAQFAAGPALDRWHLRWAYGLAVLLWSAAGAATAAARGFWDLLGFRMALGVAEAANWPAALRIVARAMPPHERAMGNGIFTSGTSAAAVVAPTLILGLAAAWGWRAAFVAVGAFGLAWFAAWILFTARSEFTPVWREPTGSRPPLAYGAVLRSPAFPPVFAVAVLVNPCLYFNVNWLTTYFVQQRGFVAGRDLGLVLTLVYLGLDLGNLFCGAASLFLAKRGIPVSTARRAVFLLATLLLFGSAAAPHLSRGPAVAALLAANVGIGIWIAMYLTMAQEVSSTNISTAMGLLGGSGSLAGALAMWAVGVVTQSTGSFAIPMTAGVLAAAAGLQLTRSKNGPTPTPV
jgi:ACS family hexuronate transporter-like MFS transporter